MVFRRLSGYVMFGRIFGAVSSSMGSSSGSGSGSTQVNHCRWDWCTKHYNSVADLESHVINEHIAHESPLDLSSAEMKTRADGKYILAELSGSALFKNVDSSLTTVATSSYQDSSMQSSNPHTDSLADPSQPQDPVHEFLTFEAPLSAPTPTSTIPVAARQRTQQEAFSSTRYSSVAPLASSPLVMDMKSSPASSAPPTQPPAPILPFGAAASPNAAGAEKKRMAGVRHSWGTGGH